MALLSKALIFAGCGHVLIAMRIGCRVGRGAPRSRSVLAAVESAWRVFLSKRTEADFQVWRNHQAWTAGKYRRFDRGERMPHDWRAIGTPV
jgi:hypothetical protein